MADDEPTLAKYEHFPPFSEWAAQGLETRTFDAYVKLLNDAKATAAPEQLSRVLEEAMRSAAVDTNAIEGLYETDRGFTRTVATQAASWEAIMDERGSSVRPAFEDALAAYEFVLDAATKRVPVTQHLVRHLHTILSSSQETYKVLTPAGWQERSLPRGEYKTEPNSPTLRDGTMFAYADPIDVQPEMARLIDELKTAEFEDAHPVLQAAYAHYAFVRIHPFADGNGRVSRALASIYLYRNPGVPFVVFADERAEYYDALEAADDGRYSAFIQFVNARVLDTIRLATTQLMSTAPALSESLKRLGVTVAGERVMSDEDYATARRLLEIVRTEFSEQLEAIKLPAHMSFSFRDYVPGYVNLPIPQGYSAIGSEYELTVEIMQSRPQREEVESGIAVYWGMGSDSPSDFCFASGSARPLPVFSSDIVPHEKTILRVQLSAWVAGIVNTLFATLADLTESGSTS